MMKAGVWWRHKRASNSWERETKALPRSWVSHRADVLSRTHFEDESNEVIMCRAEIFELCCPSLIFHPSFTVSNFGTKFADRITYKQAT